MIASSLFMFHSFAFLLLESFCMIRFCFWQLLDVSMMLSTNIAGFFRRLGAGHRWEMQLKGGQQRSKRHGTKEQKSKLMQMS